MSLDEWTSVLRLSTQWELIAIRELAIEKMSEIRMKPADMVALAQEYDIEAWLRPSFKKIPVRPADLVMEEMEGLQASARVPHIPGSSQTGSSLQSADKYDPSRVCQATALLN